jgi:ABC-type glutathione transport system ATPase component
LDSSVSSVDSVVEHDILENCIKGYLKGKTVILVTASLKVISYADRVIVMKKGTIIDSESPNKVLNSPSSLIDLQMNQLIPEKEMNPEDLYKSKASSQTKEHQSESYIKGSVITKYIENIGAPLVIIIALIAIMTQIFVISGPSWLAIWSSKLITNGSITFYILTFISISLMSMLVIFLIHF